MSTITPAQARNRIARIGEQLLADLLLLAAYADQGRQAAADCLRSSIQHRAELARWLAARYLGSSA